MSRAQDKATAAKIIERNATKEPVTSGYIPGSGKPIPSPPKPKTDTGGNKPSGGGTSSATTPVTSGYIPGSGKPIPSPPKPKTKAIDSSYAQQTATQPLPYTPTVVSNGNLYDGSSVWNGNDYQLLLGLKQQYEDAKAVGDTEGMRKAHEQAEAYRALYGYSGGADGSESISVDGLTDEQTKIIDRIDRIVFGYSRLSEDARNMGDEGLIALSAQWDQMLAMLNQLEQQISSQIMAQMNGEDPGLQNAIKVIKDEAARMRNETLEELNARGLVQSGVYARTLAEMNKGELSQIQSAVSSRFGELQAQLNDALLSFAQTRISALGAHQAAAAGLMSDTRNNILSIGAQGLNAQMTMYGQQMEDARAGQALQMSNQQFYDKLAQDNTQFNASLNRSTGGGDIAASSAGPSPEEEAYNKQLAFAQLNEAKQSGGVVDQFTKLLQQGTTTLSQVKTYLNSQGYANGVVDGIMATIEFNLRLQQAKSTTASPNLNIRAFGGYTP